jgi:hypothetical protein
VTGKPKNDEGRIEVVVKERWYRVYELRKLDEHSDVFEAVRTKFTPRNTFSLDFFVRYSNIDVDNLLMSGRSKISRLYIIGRDDLPEWAEDIRGRIVGQEPAIVVVKREPSGRVYYRGLYRVGRQPKDKKGRV